MTTTIDLSDAPRRKPVAAFVILWTMVVLVMGVLFKLQLPHVNTVYAFVNQAMEWYTLALLSLLVWKIAERLHGLRDRSVLWSAAHVVLALGVVAVWQGLQILYLRVVVGPRFWELIYATSWLFQLITALLAYGTVIGVTLALQAARRERERERREAQLAITAREAELLAIKSQLQPHFLFNSLNSVVALIDTDAPRAREMVIRLSELLQAALRRMELDDVPLEREMELVRAYLEVEKIRFSSRLGFRIDVTPDAAAIGVPPLILQPLVENAVKHGISPHAEGGDVRVAARLDGGRLHVEVSDSGGAAETAAGAGRGLDLTRRRLEGTYGNDYKLDFHRRDGRFIVALDLPLAYA